MLELINVLHNLHLYVTIFLSPLENSRLNNRKICDFRMSDFRILNPYYPSKNKQCLLNTGNGLLFALKFQGDTEDLLSVLLQLRVIKIPSMIASFSKQRVSFWIFSATALIIFVSTRYIFSR